ncbi:hypothetical protein [Polymorphospora sp. NPDC050346]|uniref:hypothetical protein n=1 Tax=Polymorphospora sp. NPDC050346 TaxID=3155780 RepID=UPI003408FAFC
MAAAAISWDWSKPAPVTGPVTAALATAAGTAVADLAGISPWWAAAAGAAGVGGTLLAGQISGLPGRISTLRCTAWLCGGTWSAWTLGTGMLWSTPAWSSLGVATLAGAALWSGGKAVRARQLRQANAAAAAAAGPITHSRDELGAEWVARIARVCRVNDVRVVNIGTWPTGAGYTLDIDLPPGGSSWKTLKPHEEGLASDARLPEGCGVTVKAGANRGSALIDVATTNAILAEAPYPLDCSVKSVNNPLSIGVWRDSSEVAGVFRQYTALYIGPDGSGKTTLMDVTIARHLETVDSIPMIIDLNGGSLAIPWLVAWRKNLDRVPEPPIGWVADNVDEALAMTNWLLTVAKDRKRTYAHLKIATNSTLLPISADVPQYEVFVDECAEILGDRQTFTDPRLAKLRDNLEEIQRIGRDSGVRMVIAGLRATAEVIGTASIKKLAGIRVAQAVGDADELNFLFGWKVKVSSEEATMPGTGHATIQRQGQPQPYRTYNLKPAGREHVVLATADRRPAIDTRARQLGGATLANRWARAADLIAAVDRTIAAAAALTGGTPPPAAPIPTATPIKEDPVSTIPPADMSGLSLDEVNARLNSAQANLAKAVADADAAAQRNRDVDPATGKPRDARLASEFDDVMQGFNLDVDPTPAAPATDTGSTTDASGAGAAPASGPTAKERCWELLKAAGTDGTGASALAAQLKADGHKTTRQTVSDWLNEWVAQGRAAQPGGDRAPYIATDNN